MQRLVPAFAYLPIVSSDPDEETVPWKGRAGFINRLWQDGSLKAAMGFEPAPDTTHVFLCGNPLMIEGMMEHLAAEGFTEHTHQQPGKIHLEKFW